MDEARQQIVDDIIRAAHERRDEIVASEVALEIVEELHDLEGSGHSWVTEFIDSLAALGAAKKYADWRRRHTVAATTKRGTDVDMPAFAAVMKRDDEGQIVYTQMRLLDMTLPQLVERRDRMSKTRDTLSVEIRLISDLIEAMQADPSLVTAGDALGRLAA